MLRKFFMAYFAFIAWFAVIVGSVGIFMNLIPILSDNVFDFGSTRMNVEVIRVEEKPAGDRSLFRPVFAILKSDETLHEHIGEMCVWPQPHEVGDVVAGRYDEKTGEITSDLMLRKSQLFNWLFLGQGAIFVFLGSWFLLWRKRKRKAA